MSSFKYNSFSTSHWAESECTSLEHCWTWEGEVRKRAAGFPCAVLTLNHQGEKRLRATGRMNSWSYFLKTQFLEAISGKELLWGGRSGGFLHSEPQLTLASAIQWCALGWYNVAGISQPEDCGAKWKHSKRNILCHWYVFDLHRAYFRNSCKPVLISGVFPF